MPSPPFPYNHLKALSEACYGSPANVTHVFIVSVEDTGSREGERVLGVYLKAEDAHARIRGFEPFDGDEPTSWSVTSEFDQTHESGATHVTRYRLDESNWWVGHVIQYEVR
jgi:hypothetical protein